MGVEIEITPAGKSMKRLTLLSGGEKSMTAIAFLFSVFLARPCPFYILDEVEAALDDVNIGRFLDLLRAYSDRAQFIVVTHQKRTMEAADTLYGVSMGNDGVSKVVSRRLPREVGAAAEARPDGQARPPQGRRARGPLRARRRGARAPKARRAASPRRDGARGRRLRPAPARGHRLRGRGGHALPPLPLDAAAGEGADRARLAAARGHAAPRRGRRGLRVVGEVPRARRPARQPDARPAAGAGGARARPRGARRRRSSARPSAPPTCAASSRPRGASARRRSPSATRRRAAPSGRARARRRRGAGDARRGRRSRSGARRPRTAASVGDVSEEWLAAHEAALAELEAIRAHRDELTRRVAELEDAADADRRSIAELSAALGERPAAEAEEARSRRRRRSRSSRPCASRPTTQPEPRLHRVGLRQRRRQPVPPARRRSSRRCARSTRSPSATTPARWACRSARRRRRPG